MGRVGCIYLPECLTSVLAHNFWLRHLVFAMLAFLQCCCLSKDLTSPIINIFVTVAKLQSHNYLCCVKFSNSSTFHWKPVRKKYELKIWIDIFQSLGKYFHLKPV